MNKILQLFSENKDALTSIGILLTFFISSISLYFSVRNNKAVHYVNAVTKNRVEWLYKFREYISALISTTTIENAELDAKDLDEYREHMGRIEKLKYLIHMHLNFSDNIDGKIDGCVEKLVSYYKGLFELCAYCRESYCENYFETEGALKYSIIKDFIAKFYEVPAFKAEMYYHLCNNSEENERFRVFFRQELSNYVKQRNEYIEELLRHVRVYLKFEWNRIKIEASGRTYKKNKQSKDLKKLYELYDRNNNKKNHNERG